MKTKILSIAAAAGAIALYLIKTTSSDSPVALETTVTDSAPSVAPEPTPTEKTTSPVLKQQEPGLPIPELTAEEFEMCNKAYQMGGAAWMAPYPHAYDDSPAQQVKLGRICQSLEKLCRIGLAVDISSASPYKESIEEAKQQGRTLRYFAFSQKGYLLFNIDPERKPL